MLIVKYQQIAYLILSIENISMDVDSLDVDKSFNKILGPGGLKLSSGQKQHVAIARAILSQPSIILFDEATNSLDSKTEAILQKSLERVTKNHTSIIITHRLNTLQKADKILVLKEGGAIVMKKYNELVYEEDFVK